MKNRIKAELKTNPKYWATVAVLMFPPAYLAVWIITGLAIYGV